MKKNDVDHEVNKLDNRVKWILIIGAFVLVVMPIAVTQLDWFFNFTETGQIGDTIGGSTAPVIGAISALLIYFSFRAQINANRIIQKQIDDQRTEEVSKKNFDHQMERYKHLREHIVDFVYVPGYPDSGREYIGSKAIKLFLHHTRISYLDNVISNKERYEFTQIKIILTFFSLIINNIIPLKDNNNSKFVFNLIEIQFYYHIWNNIKDNIEDVLKNPRETELEIFQLFERIRDIEIEMAKLKMIWPN